MTVEQISDLSMKILSLFLLLVISLQFVEKRLWNKFRYHLFQENQQLHLENYREQLKVKRVTKRHKTWIMKQN